MICDIFPYTNTLVDDVLYNYAHPYRLPNVQIPVDAVSGARIRALVQSFVDRRCILYEASQSCHLLYIPTYLRMYRLRCVRVYLRTRSRISLSEYIYS